MSEYTTKEEREELLRVAEKSYEEWEPDKDWQSCPMARLISHVDALESQLAALRTAGDGLAEAARSPMPSRMGDWESWIKNLYTATQAWQKARGDA